MRLTRLHDNLALRVLGPFGRLSTWLIVTAILVFTLAAPSRALADSIVTFDVTGTFPSISASFSPGSTITIDTTTGLATAATSLILSNGYSFTGVPNNLNQPSIYQWYFPSLAVSLFFQASPSILAAAEAGPVPAYFFYVGLRPPEISTDTAFASIPEPSSIYLLGAGLLCMIGTAFRRKRLA